MLTFFQQIFGVAWSIIDTPIPITASGATITIWQIGLFGMTVAVLIKYLFKKGQEG